MLLLLLRVNAEQQTEEEEREGGMTDKEDQRKTICSLTRSSRGVCGEKGKTTPLKKTAWEAPEFCHWNTRNQSVEI